MIDKMKTRKIGAITLVALSFLIFTAYSIRLILFKFSLPPWSVQTEGKYVAYGLEVFGFVFSLPIVVSLFLLAYLTHPSKFERFSMMTRALSLILAVVGFGIPVLLITSAIINNLPPANYIPIFMFRSIAGTSPFWIMGVSAVSSFDKDKIENMKMENKLTIFTIMTIVIMVTVWSVLFGILR